MSAHVSWKEHICLKGNGLRVSVKRKVVVEFNYSWVVQLFMDSIFSARMSETKSMVNIYIIVLNVNITHSQSDWIMNN